MKNKYKAIKVSDETALVCNKKEQEDRKAKENKLRVDEVDKIMSLHIHESHWCASIYRDVLRVHNGWIYSTYNSEDDLTSNSIFVPDNRTLTEKRIKNGKSVYM